MGKLAVALHSSTEKFINWKARAFFFLNPRFERTKEDKTADRCFGGKSSLGDVAAASDKNYHDSLCVRWLFHDFHVNIFPQLLWFTRQDHVTSGIDKSCHECSGFFRDNFEILKKMSRKSENSGLWSFTLVLAEDSAEITVRDSPSLGRFPLQNYFLTQSALKVSSDFVKFSNFQNENKVRDVIAYRKILLSLLFGCFVGRDCAFLVVRVRLSSSSWFPLKNYWLSALMT